MSGLCAICGGSGNLVSFNPLTFWQCHYCGGAGVRVQFGPAAIRARSSHTVRGE